MISCNTGTGDTENTNEAETTLDTTEAETEPPLLIPQTTEPFVCCFAPTCTTLSLCEKYLSQIKSAGIPIFTVAGNHEQFNNDQWNQYAGNDRRGSVAIEGNLFSYKTESAEFKQLVREDDRIKGLFQGHTHENTVIDMGYDYNHKKICQTGQFSQFGTLEEASKNNFWGFRELVITPDVAISNYIIAKTKFAIGGKTIIDLKRTVINSARFY